KVRIRDLARQLMPTSGQAFSARIARADLEILRTWAAPRTLAVQPLETLTEFVTTISHRMHGRAKAQAWLQAAAEAVGLYGDTDAVPFAPLAADLATEIALLEALEAARAPHERRREQLYRQLDPTMLARTVPGVAQVGAPLATAAVGRAGRF